MDLEIGKKEKNPTAWYQIQMQINGTPTTYSNIIGGIVWSGVQWVIEEEERRPFCAAGRDAKMADADGWKRRHRICADADVGVDQ